MTEPPKDYEEDDYWPKQARQSNSDADFWFCIGLLLGFLIGVAI